MISMQHILGPIYESEIPPRPKLIIGGKEPYLGYGPFHGFDNSPKIFRLTWVLHVQQYHARIAKYEIFVCLQRLNSSKISRWTKIAEIRGQPQKKDDLSRDRKLVVSRRMAGVDPGFRYQIVVRGVDIFGREGSFSKAATIVI